MVIAEMKVTTGAAIEDDERWEAVLARDATYDGAFVGAVLSTKIYCRPSCPARRPARERVVFFDTPDLAEAAGFRACLRCDPRGEKPDRARLVKEICEFLDGENEERITLAKLGSRFGVSPHHLQRTFKRAMGVSPHQYAAARRVERLKDGLRDGSDVTGALYDAGYGSSSRLYEATGKPSVSLPLDIRVTAFQGRVYQALRAIANGQTQSYGDIAKDIGRPKAVRAVANACADNPVALTVPCHRV